MALIEATAKGDPAMLENQSDQHQSHCSNNRARLINLSASSEPQQQRCSERRDLVDPIDYTGRFLLHKKSFTVIFILTGYCPVCCVAGAGCRPLLLPGCNPL